MDDHLSRLESKVLEAIDTIQNLRQENGELQQRCQDLEASLQDLQGERDGLQRQLAETREVAAQADLFEEKRRIIEDKVGGLLSKLEAMG
jgi:FtsZ-binding cell division protein ZapB